MFKIVDQYPYGTENTNQQKLQEEVSILLKEGWTICASGVYGSGRHWVHLVKDKNYHV